MFNLNVTAALFCVTAERKQTLSPQVHPPHPPEVTRGLAPPACPLPGRRSRYERFFDRLSCVDWLLGAEVVF